MNLLRSLRYFVTVVEEGHFGHAADQLDMTQPPLSQGIKRLETELGVRLLDRGPGGVTPTEAGASLLDEARALLIGEDRFLTTARSLAESSPGIRLGIDPRLPSSLVTAIAARCAEATDDTIEIATSPTTVIVDEIRRHALDVGVVVHPAVTADLETSDVHRLPTWLLLPTAVAADGGPQRTLRQLMALPLAVGSRDDGPAAHDLVVDTLLEHGCRHGVRIVPDERPVLAMVAASQVCALTADENLVAQGVTPVPVPGGLLPLRLRVVWRRDSSDAVCAAAERIGAVTAALSQASTQTSP